MISLSCLPERVGRDPMEDDVRGVKNRVNRFGVIGGGFFGLVFRASETWWEV